MGSPFAGTNSSPDLAADRNDHLGNGGVVGENAKLFGEASPSDGTSGGTVTTTLYILSGFWVTSFALKCWPSVSRPRTWSGLGRLFTIVTLRSAGSPFHTAANTAPIGIKSIGAFTTPVKTSGIWFRAGSFRLTSAGALRLWLGVEVPSSTQTCPFLPGAIDAAVRAVISGRDNSIRVILSGAVPLFSNSKQWETVAPCVMVPKS